MKKELYEQATQSLMALGMSFDEISKAMVRAASVGYKMYSNPVSMHRRRCVIVARAMARQHDPQVRAVLWYRFKHL